MCSAAVCTIEANTVWWKTFEGENFCDFQSFVAIRVKIFFKRFEGVASFGDTSKQSTKFFSVKFFYTDLFFRESFQLYTKQCGLDFFVKFGLLPSVCPVTFSMAVMLLFPWETCSEG